MRLSRFFAIVLVLTSISLAHIHQKTQIIKLNIDVNSSSRLLNIAVDQNLHLLYNNLVLESPESIDARLAAQKIALVRPQSWQRISIRKKQEVKPSDVATIDIFRLGSIAEAGVNNDYTDDRRLKETDDHRYLRLEHL